MSGNFYFVQLGGNSVTNDDAANCQFPAHPMMPLSCAADNGYPEIDHCWTGPTAGHRGHGSFANSRVLHFEDPKESVYCRPNCLVDRPHNCGEIDECKPQTLGVEGWNNQVGLYDYYCRIKNGEVNKDGSGIEVGDCFVTHMVPAIEKFDSFTWGVTKGAPGVIVKFKLLCAGIDLTPEIDASEAGQKLECFKVPAENQFASLCDGFDIVVMEIVAKPPEPVEDNCKKEKGCLDGLAIMGSVRTEAICTGK